MSRNVKESLKDSHIICCLEGSAEEAIIKKLYTSDKLLFKNQDFFDGVRLERHLTRTRKATKLAEEYLYRDYGSQPVIFLRILDSKKEKFKFPKVFEKRVKSGEIKVINILTIPEIEILIIINEGSYERYQKHRGRLKASEFCKQELGFPKVKKYEFVQKYFDDLDKLLAALEDHHNMRKSYDELTIYDLLDV